MASAELEPYESPVEDEDEGPRETGAASESDSGSGEDDFEDDSDAGADDGHAAYADYEDDFALPVANALRGLSISSPAESPSAPRILPAPTLAAVADYIKAKKPKNIVVLCGAGISTAAGIPDFRSPGTGLYSNLQRYNLPHPEAVFEISYFRRNPMPFYQLSRELFPGKHYPTTTHYFLSLLHEKNLLRRVYTQNIDTLETLAGVPREKIVEAHGSFGTASCAGGWVPDSLTHFIDSKGNPNLSYNSTDPKTSRRSCGQSYSTSLFSEHVREGRIPLCQKCRGLVKPDIVFFGESLPQRFFHLLDEDFESSNCDLVIIMGTSLQVGPFNQLPTFAPKHVPRLLLNLEPAGGFGKSVSTPPFRDAFWKGGCDEGVQELARLLGWDSELDALKQRGHSKLRSLWTPAPSPAVTPQPKKVTIHKPTPRQVITSGGVVIEEEFGEVTGEELEVIEEVVASLGKK